MKRKISDIYYNCIEVELDEWFTTQDLSCIHEHEEITADYIRKLNRMADIITEQRVFKLSMNLWWLLKEEKKKENEW